jgi:hypothetical protein
MTDARSARSATKAIRSAGARVHAALHPSGPHATTHAVFETDESGRPKVSEEYLLAIASGCWVLNECFLLACKALATPLSAQSDAFMAHFEVRHDATGESGARRSRLQRERGESGVLHGLRFDVDFGTMSATGLQRPVLMRLIIANDGIVVDSSATTAREHTELPCVHIVDSKRESDPAAPGKPFVRSSMWLVQVMREQLLHHGHAAQSLTNY